MVFLRCQRAESPKKRTKIIMLSSLVSSLVVSSFVPIATVGATPTSSISNLVATLTQAQADVDAIDLEVGRLREEVNRTLVDLHDAQSRAAQARVGVAESSRMLDEALSAVSEARAALSEMTRSQYRSANGTSGLGVLAGAETQKDILERSRYLQQQSAEKQSKLRQLERAQTVAANEQARQKHILEIAEEAEATALQKQADAELLLESASAKLDTQLQRRDSAVAAVESAQRDISDQKPQDSDTLDSTSAPSFDSGTKLEISDDILTAVEARVQQLVPELSSLDQPSLIEAVQTAQRAGDYDVSYQDDAESPITLGEVSEQEDLIADAANVAAASALIGSSQQEHATLESPYVGSSSLDTIAAFANAFNSVLTDYGVSDSGSNQGSISEVVPPIGSLEDLTNIVQGTLGSPNQSAVETVIARAESMIGTPYVWGGGDANGPTAGVDGGSQLGFDCSGLVLYAFAAAGVSLPHYTGYQYQRGTPVDPSNAQRGDLLFWGPGGSQHVAIYLGDGMMIEAPQAGDTVRVSPVRWAGMSPNAVRLL